MHLITPNLNEASLLWGRTIAGTVEMQQAAQELSCRYNTAVLVKGGHLEGNDMCDVLYCRQPSAGLTSCHPDASSIPIPK